MAYFTFFLISCEYKYVELKLYPKIVWFKEHQGTFKR